MKESYLYNYIVDQKQSKRIHNLPGTITKRLHNLHTTEAILSPSIDFKPDKKCIRYYNTKISDADPFTER